jgi:uncharacterized protein YndB with AHSA1/START domain
MGAVETGVVGVDGVVLVSGVALFADELHAVVIDASVTPTISIERNRIMNSPLFPPASEGEHTLRPMTDSRDIETVERTIPQPADAIFAFLADPRRHRDIDGSGAVREAKNSPERVKLGDQFSMAMKLGVPYTMVSTIIEFEDNRRIAWQSRSPGLMGKVTGGRIWRYELEPVDGGTRVRETWDISQERGTKVLLRAGRVHQHTRESMEATLEKIEKLLANA